MRVGCASELGGEQTGHVHSRTSEEGGDRPQQNQGRAEELRGRGKKGSERGLIHVPPLQLLAADYEIELIAEEAVVRVSNQVESEGGYGRHHRNAAIGFLHVQFQSRV